MRLYGRTGTGLAECAKTEGIFTDTAEMTPKAERVIYSDSREIRLGILNSSAESCFTWVCFDTIVNFVCCYRVTIVQDQDFLHEAALQALINEWLNLQLPTPYLFNYRKLAASS